MEELGESVEAVTVLYRFFLVLCIEYNVTWAVSAVAAAPRR